MVPRFWRKIKYRYDVVGSHCENCGSHYYPKREICPRCRRRGKLKDEKFPDEGTILSYTVVNGKIIAMIGLNNGAKTLAEVCADKVEIGMKVKKAFRRYGEDGEAGIIYYGTKFVPSS